MRWIRLAAILALATAPAPAVVAAQETGRVSGTVVDDAGEPVYGASVSSVEARRGTLTDDDGRYTLELPAGRHTIEVTMLGYAARSSTVTVTAGGEADLDFSLARDVLALQEIVVTGTRTARRQQ
ncbi:MAG: carboxypeptidase-like regulatory domain-containing protein, partial [Gemmatimonadota bacterium]